MRGSQSDPGGNNLTGFFWKTRNDLNSIGLIWLQDADCRSVGTTRIKGTVRPKMKVPSSSPHVDGSAAWRRPAPPINTVNRSSSFSGRTSSLIHNRGQRLGMPQHVRHQSQTTLSSCPFAAGCFFFPPNRKNENEQKLISKPDPKPRPPSCLFLPV